MSTTSAPAGLLSQLVQRAKSLYSLPTVANQVLELTRQPDLDPYQLKDCIEKDPALTAKLLRVVNSSLFGLSCEVADLSHAISLLGTRPLRLLVLGFSLPRELFSGVEARILQHYWRQSVVKAVAAREISEQIWNVSGEEAFIAGLLQDIGQLVMIQQLGESYTQFLDTVSESNCDLLELEESRLGFNYTQLSTQLLAEWGLPRATVANLEKPYDIAHTMSLPPKERVLPQVLHLAELTTILITQNAPNALHELLDISVDYHVDLRIDQVRQLVEALDTKVKELAAILDIHVLTRDNYMQVLLDGMAQISVVTDDVALTLATAERSSQTNSVARAGHSIVEERVTEMPAQDDAVSDSRTFRESPTAGTGPPLDSPTRNEPTKPSLEITDSSVMQSELAQSFSYSEFLRQVGTVVSSARQTRQAVNLVLVEVDDFESIVISHGPEKTAAIFRSFSQAVLRLLGNEGHVMHVGDRRWAILLEGLDRQQAVRMIRSFQDVVRSWFQQRVSITKDPITVSIGLACLTLPPRDFQPVQLVEAAESCLDGAQLQSGDVLKSIEL